MTHGRVGRNALITSVATVATMAAGGVLAVLAANLVGANAGTDGFFAAYGLYAMAVVFAQSARTTVVPRLLEGETRFAAFDRFLGGGVVVVLVAAVLLGPLGGPIASLATGDLPGEARETARTALLILLPAIAAQVFAALGAAMLGALGDFALPGFAFTGGAAASIVAFVALEPSLSIDGLAVALLVGSAVSAAAVAAGLVRHGWRPSRAVVAAPRAAASAAGVLLVASLSILIAHFGYLVTLAVGARLGEGVITAFSYGYMGFNLVFALIAGSIPMVIVGPLAEHWDRRPASLVEHNERVFRAGLLLLAPVIAAVALVGHEVGDVALAKFTAGEVDLTVDLFLLLSPLVVFGLVQAVPYAAVLVRARYKAVALATAGVVVVQVGLVLLAGEMDSARLLGLAFPVANLVNLVAAMLLVSRGYPKLVVPRLAAALLRLAAVALVAFGVPVLLADALDLRDWVALLAGLVAYGVAVAALLPVERDLGRRVLRTALPVGS
ncbi:MAG TPA: lipid II flippase MurJ [Solirubrobacteraceae bacterium]|nr:lipid II flippase MurJ [Solirubrobacteraceae bacterium]